MLKYIKYYIRFIEKFFYPFEASPLIKLNRNDKESAVLGLNIKNKKKKTFYIIKRTPGAGLFSNFIFVLNHLKIAKSCGYTPIVDMENFPTIYNEKEKINHSKNSWNYYFDNKTKLNLNKIYRNYNYILTSNRFSKSFSNKIDNDEFRNNFKKYYKIKKNYINFANLFAKKNFDNKTLAIHLRGTSYKTSANHPFPTTKRQTFYIIDKILSENKYTKIFLCTEDLNYLNLIRNKYKNKVIFLKNVYRSYNDDAFKIYPKNFHRFKLGRDILIESLLISKCKGFLFTNTNVSEFVKFLDEKKKIDYYLIQNDFNSKNPYIAKWLWYYKNLFPKFLGGFKKTVYVKKN